MLFVAIGVIIIFVFEYNNIIDSRKFIQDTEPYFHFLMEDDYKFLLNIRYGGQIDDDAVYELFSKRIRNALIVAVILFVFLLNKMSFVYLLVIAIVAVIVFKSDYTKLKGFYKSNLHQINLMLPYYLKSLEILIQHYTVPVALSKSIDTAPEIFRSGLRSLVAKIESGDSTVDPYMDFAHEYPVRDSMRMMRLLYRLGLGSNETKQEQLMMFSKTVSTLQNKSREQKYKERLEKMEGKTMMMLGGTGGGILLFMLMAMYMMMGTS